MAASSSRRWRRDRRDDRPGYAGSLSGSRRAKAQFHPATTTVPTRRRTRSRPALAAPTRRGLDGDDDAGRTRPGGCSGLEGRVGRLAEFGRRCRAGRKADIRRLAARTPAASGEERQASPVRLSPFDSAHRRQTCSATVIVALLFPDDIDVEIDEGDLKIDTFQQQAGRPACEQDRQRCASPTLLTGIVVQCQNERLQSANKQTATRKPSRAWSSAPRRSARRRWRRNGRCRRHRLRRRVHPGSYKSSTNRSRTREPVTSACRASSTETSIRSFITCLRSCCRTSRGSHGKSSFPTLSPGQSRPRPGGRNVDDRDLILSRLQRHLPSRRRPPGGGAMAIAPGQWTKAPASPTGKVDDVTFHIDKVRVRGRCSGPYKSTLVRSPASSRRAARDRRRRPTDEACRLKVPMLRRNIGCVFRTSVALNRECRERQGAQGRGRSRPQEGSRGALDGRSPRTG